MNIALVTGSGQGIGRAIGLTLCKAGWETVFSDINEDAAEGACEAAKQEGGSAHAVQLDVSNIDCLKEKVEQIENKFGPIDGLVNCAGICLTRAFFEIEREGFEKTFAINVEGLFFLLQAVAARMRPRHRGAIVNITSVSGFMPKLEQLDYGASKAAVVSITRSAALALGPVGIRVNAVAPGVIDTPLTQAIAVRRGSIRGQSPEETLKPVIEGLPLRRMGTSEEVAKVVQFLLSDEASYVTGQTIDVCGGQWMR